ncbi:MAG: hypothetical protein EHM35_20885 [Planctomycetaceae bacterium]|nr:MAG: hypothetical protein EHM35_20885 [Planctomycetaceae bacterium]
MLSQLPQLAPGELERWLASASVVGGLALLWLKLKGRTGPGEYVTRPEWREFRTSVERDLTALRDRVDSRHLGVLESIEKLQASLHSENERRDAALHRRLADMEAGLARLDERTK